jgi:hypothetical protein
MIFPSVKMPEQSGAPDARHYNGYFRPKPANLRKLPGHKDAVSLFFEIWKQV